MTPAIQLFLLLTVGQNMMTWSDPAPDPLDELHVHLHLTDEDKEEKQIYNKYLLAGQGDDYTSSGKGKEKADSQSQKAWPAPNSQADQHGSKVVNGNNNGNRWFVRPRW